MCVSHMQSDTRLSRFSACNMNIKKLGGGLGTRLRIVLMELRLDRQRRLSVQRHVSMYWTEKEEEPSVATKEEYTGINLSRFYP